MCPCIFDRTVNLYLPVWGAIVVAKLAPGSHLFLGESGTKYGVVYVAGGRWHAFCTRCFSRARSSLVDFDTHPPLKGTRNVSGTQMEIEDGLRPLKRVRTDVHRSSGSVISPLSNIPPLSLSILGVEPMDEFIREIADFIYHMIGMRPRDSPGAMVEVEAKIGILRDRLSGNRLNLPVLTETSESAIRPGHCSDTLTWHAFEQFSPPTSVISGLNRT